MALKPNQLQVTTYYPQANAIIERVHKVVNEMLRSFDSENNHENLEEQEDFPCDYLQDIINKSNQKENKSQIPYEYKIGDQVLLETPGILRKLSTPRTGPYPVTNVYKNGTIKI
jgi:transposase InsO family protein